MSEYRCSQCGETYARSEYNALEKVPVDPDEDNPMEGQGYERACGECGARMHSDKWHRVREVETDHGDVTVSTVALLIPHGLHHNQWFETCLLYDGGSEVVERYEDQDAAEAGHEEIVEQLQRGWFSVQPTGERLVLEGGDGDE